MKRFYERHFFLLDPAFAALVAAVAYRFSLVTKFGPETRELIYTALTPVFGALLGFVITGVSVMIAFSESERLSRLRESKHYRSLFRIFTRAAKILGVGFLATFAGLAFDTAATPRLVFAYVSLGCVVAAIFALTHCIRVLDAVVDIVTVKRG